MYSICPEADFQPTIDEESYKLLHDRFHNGKSVHLVNLKWTICKDYFRESFKKSKMVEFIGPSLSLFDDCGCEL